MASKLRKRLIYLVVSAGFLGSSGCATTYAGEGALLGAGTGAIIGHQHHKQTLEGAAIGGVLGGLLGSQIKKDKMYVDPIEENNFIDSYKESFPKYYEK